MYFCVFIRVYRCAYVYEIVVTSVSVPTVTTDDLTSRIVI